MEGQKRKWTSYHSKDQRKKKQAYIDSGMRGFLCTCNFREKECIRDAYRLLEKFEDDFKNDDVEAKTIQDEAEKSKDKEEQEDDDISAALHKELEELKKESDKPAAARKFQYIDTGVKNCIFISTTLANPLELAMNIFKDLDETKEGKSRFLMRLIPVQLICKANIDDIKAKSKTLIHEYFGKEGKTFSVVFNRHYNNSLSRNDVINVIAALIGDENPENKADLTSPDIAVVVEIIKGHCLISIAPEYFKYKKYNLLELCNIKEDVKSDGKKCEIEGEEGKSDEKKTETDGEKKKSDVDAEEKKLDDSKVSEPVDKGTDKKIDSSD